MKTTDKSSSTSVVENYDDTKPLIKFFFGFGSGVSILLLIFVPESRKYFIDISILLFVLWLIALIAISFQTFAFDKNSNLKTNKEKRDYVGNFSVLMFGLLFGIQSLMLGVIYIVYKILILILQLNLLNTFSILFAMVLILIVGYAFYVFRLKCRAVYGAFEIIFSLLFILHLNSNFFNKEIGITSFLVGIATAGVYIIVRGMDNIQAALIDPTKDALVQRLPVRFIKRMEVIFMAKKP